MIEITQEQIERINTKCPYNQGIFFEPFGIPTNIKELVIYTKWTSGGRPGSCYDDEDTVNEEYTRSRPYDALKVVDELFKELGIKIEIQDYEIAEMMDSNTYTDYGYYGDYTEDTIEWVSLYKFLETVTFKLRDMKMKTIL